jgi:hypothetical protein
LVRSVRYSLLLLSFLVLARIPLLAADWPQPTPEQLKMTSDPDAPGAAAVYLDWDQRVDNSSHYDTVSATLKILSQKGVEKFSDVEILYPRGSAYVDLGQVAVTAIEGRTIEADGTVIPFTGKPFDKEVLKFGGARIMEKVFTMPKVQVGSIVQYRYEVTFSPYFYESPWFILQRRAFVHHGHYQFIPGSIRAGLMYTPILPPGAKLNGGVAVGYDLVVDDVPAAPDEDYLPPLGSMSYQLDFYFTYVSSQKQFWEQTGQSWSKNVNRFDQDSPVIRAAVAQVVAPGDSDESKLEKIYATVMALDNTDFTREHTQQENKAEHQQVKTAADIWSDKRGNGNEMALLFVAMVRAAGLNAYVMATTNRSNWLMNANILSWDQLSDEVAIVSVDGKDMYFDPGDRYCAFGKLGWIHAQMLGIRQTESGTEEASLPPQTYTDNETFRKADLTLGKDGTVQGQIRIVMKGVDALRWRQDALNNDAEQAQRDFEKEMQGRVPDGVHVKMDGFDALTDPAANLVATLDVSGTMGTTAGKRLIEPAAFFEANAKPPFADQTRQNPIDMRYPYAQQDEVTITLGPGLSTESLPKGDAIPMAKGGEYKAIYSQTSGGFTAVRLMALGNTIFTQKDYPMLRGFFQNAAAQDQEQVVLRRNK